MNKLNSKQRKRVYGLGIVILLGPIMYLGAPTSEDVQPGTNTAVSGGKLAQLRVEYDLGESTLGDIDPSSAAMNLVLLGLRGPAAGLLHLQALEYQEKKNWPKLKTTVNSIIKLQPHYFQIWKFQGWNLAFNVSREWDKVADRFFWVKEGIKFIKLGTVRNQTEPILYYDVGDYVGRKVGNSDEKRFFRKFFLQDPDEKYAPGADTELNPDNKDNYLVSYDWMVEANEKGRIYPVRGKEIIFFRQGPSRALFSYAAAKQDDGPIDTNADGTIDDNERRAFSEENVAAWERAHQEWTEVYGHEPFLGLNDIKFYLNSSEKDLQDLASENGVTLETQRKVNDQNVKMVNYTFWTNYANCERSPLTADAHAAIRKGKQAFRTGRTSDSVGADGTLQISDAERYFFEGLQKLERVFQEFPTMAEHDAYQTEAMLAIYYWEQVHQFNGKSLPADFPLRAMAEANRDMMPDIIRDFNMENRGSY